MELASSDGHLFTQQSAIVNPTVGARLLEASHKMTAGMDLASNDGLCSAPRSVTENPPV